MGAINFEHRLYASALRHATRCASPRRLMRWLRRTGAMSAEAARQLVEQHRGARVTTPEEAVHRAVAEDLADLLGPDAELDRALAGWEAPDSAVATAMEQLSTVFSELGIEVDPPPVHIVDRLPGPYLSAALAAVSLDTSEAGEYGARPGVYVVRSRLAPFFTEATLGHVLVHVALGQRSPELLGRGLEEGVAELLGGIEAAGRIIGETQADAAFLGHRWTAHLSPERESLLANMRAARHLLATIGFDGLVRTVDHGRTALKEAERDSARQTPSITLNETDHARLARLDRLLLRAPRPLTVSAHAAILAEHLTPGRTLMQAASTALMADGLARTAAAELSERVYLVIVFNDGEIAAEDCRLMLELGALRYALDDN